MYNMEHFNLLDLDNDVLNIIGDYVKKDILDKYHRRKDKESRTWIFQYVNDEVKEIKF
jgi:hypothetical protein